MDYRYIHPLYTEDDKDQALEALIKYTENNNKAEYEVTHTDTFIQHNSIIPKEFIKHAILNTYGVNIITIANVLAMQDLFFSIYMNHINKYLDLVGVKHYISYIRPSRIVDNLIIKKISSGILPSLYWNPNEVWTDFSYKDNYEANLFNPLNNFYQADIILNGVINKGFIDFLINTNIPKIDSDGHIEGPMDIKIHMLPTLSPVKMIQIIKAIHKYF